MIEVDGQAAAASIDAATRELRELVESLGGEYEAVFSLDDDASHRLTWLASGGRDFLQVTPFVRDAVWDAVRARFEADLAEGRLPGVLPALTVGASAMRDAFVERLESSGGDVTMAPLSPEYVAAKARRGDATGIGKATGHTVSSLKAALVIVRRSR